MCRVLRPTTGISHVLASGYYRGGDFSGTGGWHSEMNPHGAESWHSGVQGASTKPAGATRAIHLVNAHAFSTLRRRKKERGQF